MTPRYEVIESSAAAGGFGKVEKAKDTQLDRFVAIKTLDPIFKDSPSEEDKERFKREAITLAKLSHPNIPAIYDIKHSEVDEELKLIFEWIEGTTVRKSLAERGVMSLEETKRWFANICSALDHAHKRGVIHRDIKPSNIIITENLEACYLVDFGISLRESDLQRLTNGSPIGTPGYMSSEQENGEELDASSDIYVLAILLYECLCGTKPSIGHYTTLNSQNESIPPAIDDLIRGCLSERGTRLAKSASGFMNRLGKALTPHASFSDTLSQGSLHEIQIAIANMEPNEFITLPKGQRILMATRIKDLVRVDNYGMRNAVAAMLAEMVRVSHLAADKNYDFFVEQGLQYGYEMKYGQNWQGNIQIRESLNRVAVECQGPPHETISVKTLEFLQGIDDLKEKEKWYFHDLRILLQNLLANPECNDESAEKVGAKLERVNEVSHERWSHVD